MGGVDAAEVRRLGADRQPHAPTTRAQGRRRCETRPRDETGRRDQGPRSATRTRSPCTTVFGSICDAMLADESRPQTIRRNEAAGGSIEQRSRNALRGARRPAESAATKGSRRRRRRGVRADLKQCGDERRRRSSGSRDELEATDGKEGRRRTSKKRSPAQQQGKALHFQAAAKEPEETALDGFSQGGLATAPEDEGRGPGAECQAALEAEPSCAADRIHRGRSSDAEAGQARRRQGAAGQRRRDRGQDEPDGRRVAGFKTEQSDGRRCSGPAHSTQNQLSDAGASTSPSDVTPDQAHNPTGTASLRGAMEDDDRVEEAAQGPEGTGRRRRTRTLTHRASASSTSRQRSSRR